MRRMIWLLAGVLLVVPSLGSDSPKGYDGATIQEDDLQGEWRTVNRDWTADRQSPDLTFRGGKYVAAVGGFAEVGTYTIDTSRRPAHLNQTTVSRFGPLYRNCIYRIDGDTL